MMNQHETNIKHKKAEDLQTFSKVVFAFAAFLSFGLYIPDTYPQEKELFVLGFTVILLSVSILFYYIARKEKKSIEDN